MGAVKKLLKLPFAIIAAVLVAVVNGLWRALPAAFSAAWDGRIDNFERDAICQKLGDPVVDALGRIPGITVESR